jgi:hypothetical protein
MDTELAGVKIVNLTRLANTRATGNPRWLVLLSDGTEAETWPDADVAFGIENSEYQDTPLTVVMRGRFITRLWVENPPRRRTARIEPQHDMDPFPELRGEDATTRPHVITADEAKAESRRIGGQGWRA